MTLRVLQAITSVRVGDGSSAGAMNLPVSRERHTRWPFIPGSSLKGALRIRATVMRHSHVDGIFGASRPDDDDDDTGSKRGALLVGGATLLALPVRSLHTTFALLTCPTALARFGRAAGLSLDLPSPSVEEAWVQGANQVREQKEVAVGSRARGTVVLEDLDLVGVTDDAVSAWAQAIGGYTGTEAPLSALTVVHDDVFAHACAAWTEHRTRNAIGADGVVDQGKLFVVESLPAETLLWATLDWDERFASEIPRFDGLPANGECFTLGGHQSVGMGRITWYGGAS